MFVLTNTASAQSASDSSKLFGGMSQMVQFCTCDATIMISILNAASDSVEYFIFNPISTELHDYAMFMMSGVNMLGSAEMMTTQCKIVSGSSCTSVGNGYPIKMLGTSLPF